MQDEPRSNRALPAPNAKRLRMGASDEANPENVPAVLDRFAFRSR
jgi:hypothetical protein